MIEKGKISTLQMAILIYPTIIATAILLVPAITGEQARQDMWMSPIWASAAGFLSAFIAIQLNKRFPEQTIIQYSETIAGKFLGKVIGFVFIFFLAHICGVILREYGEFVKGNFLDTTPMIVILGSIAFVCALAVRGGLEVIARSAQIFVPVVTVLFIFVLLLLSPELNPANMLPVFEKGLMPSLRGAVVPAGWYLEFFMISFLLPFLRDRKKAVKWSAVTVIAVLITMVITNMVTLFVFGSLTPKFTYPVMEAARYISIAEFIQHMESVVMAIWVGGIFVKISVFFYAAVLSTAQWLNLSDYRPLVFPIALIVTVLGHWSASNLQELEIFLSETFPFYSFIFLAVIPVILLLAAAIRGKRSNKSSN
ncbi:MAG TPA: endospore germination permease [Lentibacillus sp.]|uniref:GerAB/ArcD/ProY family transporter n=1 Tax=Lentibacillus sp. TaxID=1925746 RepID=UPI002B4B3DFA|nr:endospore germination permease [Lentibacillus sp.]HLR61368.1 endospore germination permease [Lentibacillus sp.]